MKKTKRETVTTLQFILSGGYDASSVFPGMYKFQEKKKEKRLKK